MYGGLKPCAPFYKLCGKLGGATLLVNIYKGPSQVGSLAGAAHLLNDNAGVQWRAQTERKSVVEQKGKSSLNDDFQYEYSLRNHGLSILSLKIFFDL